jgi:uncharacterized alkaline shock family protein YloU
MHLMVRNTLTEMETGIPDAAVNIYIVEVFFQSTTYGTEPLEESLL